MLHFRNAVPLASPIRLLNLAFVVGTLGASSCLSSPDALRRRIRDGVEWGRTVALDVGRERGRETELLDLGIAVSTEPDTELLLERLLSYSRFVSRAEAGMIFVHDSDGLRLSAVQNDFLVRRLGEGQMKRYLLDETVSLTTPSVCVYVARTGEVVNVMDAYAVGQVGNLRFDQAIDRRTGYVTCSVLAMPLRVANGPILGVLELTNALDEDAIIVPFEPGCEPVVRWCASLMAMALAARPLRAASRDSRPPI